MLAAYVYEHVMNKNGYFRSQQTCKSNDQCILWYKFLSVYYTNLMIKSVNLCKCMACCSDVLTDKLHPWFLTKILSKMLQLICRCLRWYTFTPRMKGAGAYPPSTKKSSSRTDIVASLASSFTWCSKNCTAQSMPCYNNINHLWSSQRNSCHQNTNRRDCILQYLWHRRLLDAHFLTYED